MMTEQQIHEAYWVMYGFKMISFPVEGGVIFYGKAYGTDRTGIIGYDEMETMAMFDEQGKLIKGALDSHVALVSDEYGELRKLLPSTWFEEWGQAYPAPSWA